MKYLNLIVIIFLFNCFAHAQSVMNQKELDEIVKKEITRLNNEGSKYAARHIYMLIDEKDYKLETLKRLVETYSAKFPSPKILSINIFTEEKGLDAAIWIETKSYSPSFGGGEEDKRAAKAYSDKYFPKITGYRAGYLRHFSSEVLLYAEEKDSDESIKIDLKAEKQ